jgi:hypothetical protein
LTLILTLYSLKNSGTMDANRYRTTLTFDRFGRFNAKKVIMDFASLIQILPPQPQKEQSTIRWAVSFCFYGGFEATAFGGGRWKSGAAPPGADAAAPLFPQRSKNRRISVSPNGFSPPRKAEAVIRRLTEGG